MRARLLVFRWLWRLVGGVALLVAAALVLAITLVLAPPGDLIRRVALPIAQDALRHHNIHIGALELDPLHKVEVREIWIGPPEGYRLPLATIERITAEYDVSEITNQRVTVRRVEVVRPTVFAETRKGKLNWLAFVENLPPSPPKPEEPPSEPPEITVDLQRVAVLGFAAYFADDKQRALLDGLDIKVSGTYAAKGAKLKAGVYLEPPSASHGNLALRLLAPQPLFAQLDGRIALEATVHDLAPPRADVKLDVKLATRTIDSKWKLDPIALALSLGASFDQGSAKAALERLTVHFNKRQLVDLAARVTGIGERPALAARLASLDLPLDLFAPYVRAVDERLAFGGRVQVKDLQLDGALDQLDRPRKLVGRIDIRDVWARVAGDKKLQAELKDLDATLRFAARHATGGALEPAQALAGLPALDADPETVFPPTAETPPLIARGRLSIGEASGGGAKVSGLELRLAAGLDRVGDKPGAFAARIGLRVPRVVARQPGLGVLRTSIETDVEASGHAGRGDVDLSQLRLAVGRLLRLELSAKLRAREQVDARLALGPIVLGRAVRQLPGRLRRQLGALGLVGRVGLDLHLRGTLPRLEAGSPLSKVLARGGPAPLLAYCCSHAAVIPLRVDGKISLRGVGMHDAKAGLRVEGVGGAIALSARPGRLHLGGRIAIARVATPDARVSKLALPLDLTLAPTRLALELGVEAEGLSAAGAAVSGLQLGVKLGTSPRMVTLPRKALPLTLDLDAKVARVTQGGIQARGITLRQRLRTAVAPGQIVGAKRFALPAARVELDAAVARVAAALPGNAIDVGKVAAKLGIELAPRDAKKQLALDLSAKVGSLAHRQQALSLAGITATLKTSVSGLPRQVPPPPLDLRRLASGPTTLRLGVASLMQRGVIDPALRNSEVALRARLRPGGRLDLDALAVRAPSRGVRLDVNGRVDRAFDRHPLMPPFDLQVNAAVETPRTAVLKQSTLLATGVRAAGKLGIGVRLRRVDPRRVRVEARLIADHFNLWQRGLSTVERDGGGLLRSVSLLSLKDFNADVPIAQDLLFKRAGVALPRPKSSIFAADGKTALYSAMRPYAARRSNVSLSGVTLDEQITAVNNQGHFVNTKKRSTHVGRVSLDLAVADSTFSLSRFHVQVFGGDVTGAIEAQLVRLAPLDVRLKLRTQVTGIDLGYLDPSVKRDAKNRSEISTLIDLKYQLAKRYVAGRIDITEMSLQQLDGMLAYLDPNNVNESVKKNRELLNSWYMKAAEIKLVAIWIDHGNLNMDIEIDAPIVGGIIQSVLKNNRIRRLNIMPLLPQAGGEPRGNP